MMEQNNRNGPGINPPVTAAVDSTSTAVAYASFIKQNRTNLEVVQTRTPTEGVYRHVSFGEGVLLHGKEGQKGLMHETEEIACAGWNPTGGVLWKDIKPNTSHCCTHASFSILDCGDSARFCVQLTD